MATNVKYVPFVRNDFYGEAGMEPQPLHEKLRMMLMAVLLAPLKALGVGICIVSVFLCCKISTLLPASVAPHFVTWSGKVGSRLCLFCYGFVQVKWVQHDGSSAGRPKDQYTIVSNHVGFLDILVHMSRSFPSFVARDGTQNIPLIGMVSRLMQCIYVDREKTNGGPTGIAGQVKERMLQYAAKTDKNMRPMLLFPEGTTTNGKFLLQFKTGAFLAGTPVQPVILKYDTEALLMQHRVSPSWETISASRLHFLMFCQPVHTVTCYELPVYHPSKEEQEDPALYARNVREYMVKYSKLQPSDATLEDKRQYQHELRQRLGIGTQPKKEAKQNGSK